MFKLPKVSNRAAILANPKPFVTLDMSNPTPLSWTENLMCFISIDSETLMVEAFGNLWKRDNLIVKT